MKQDSGLTGVSSNSSTIKNIENILIMLGGGSLGAFGCGVFKGLMKRNTSHIFFKYRGDVFVSGVYKGLQKIVAN